MKNIQRYIIFSFLFTVCIISTALSKENPFEPLKNSALSYFKPLKGKIVSVSSDGTVADIGTSSQAKKGMRFSVVREGASFLHPVTKEPIGLVETAVGKVEIKDVSSNTSSVTILNGDVKPEDKIRISETGVKALFYQSANVDWSLGDAYFRTLKDTGRFELLETAIESDNQAEIIKEAKKQNADVLIMLAAKDAGGDVKLKQSLFWVEDSSKLSEDEVKVPLSFIKDLKFGEEMLGIKKEDVARELKLPVGGRFILAADVNGDKKTELLVSTDRDIRMYTPDGELSTVYKIKGSYSDENLWFDKIDLNKNGRDEIIITFFRYDTVVSRIYELQEDKFVMLWEGKVFLKAMGNELFAQEFDQGDGYKGPVYQIVWDNGYKRGSDVKLPTGVNIYDFAYIKDEDKKMVIAYDDAGYLNLYDDKGLKLWRSSEDYGGFLTKFKRAVPNMFIDRGEWSIKDRIFVFNKSAYVIRRLPLVGMARGVGFSSSQIKNLWFTGASMEERTIVDYISGSALDFGIADDKIVVLDSPAVTLSIKKLFKGEGLYGSLVYIYSLKGR
ncbi:MAG: hypothetical protein LLF28_01360 [Nitrospiraceae bacterium]|nr:hypothetical protein [Nitrospiraceae bacterium]